MRLFRDCMILPRHNFFVFINKKSLQKQRKTSFNEIKKHKRKLSEVLAVTMLVSFNVACPTKFRSLQKRYDGYWSSRHQ